MPPSLPAPNIFAAVAGAWGVQRPDFIFGFTKFGTCRFRLPFLRVSQVTPTPSIMMLATTPRATTPAATAATAAGIALLFVGVLAATPASGPDAAIFPTVMINVTSGPWASGASDANEGLRGVRRETSPASLARAPRQQREPPLDAHAGITRLDGMEGGEGTCQGVLGVRAGELWERQGMGLAYSCMSCVAQ